MLLHMNDGGKHYRAVDSSKVAIDGLQSCSSGEWGGCVRVPLCTLLLCLPGQSSAFSDSS